MTTLIPEPLVRTVPSTLPQDVREVLQRARENLLTWGWTTGVVCSAVSGKICAVGGILSGRPDVVRVHIYSPRQEMSIWTMNTEHLQEDLTIRSAEAVLKAGGLNHRCACTMGHPVIHALEQYNDHHSEEEVIALFDKALAQ